MERLWWAPGVQLEPTHNNLLPVRVGSGKRDCVSCKTLEAKEAGVHSPQNICRDPGSLERPQLQPHEAAGEDQQESGMGTRTQPWAGRGKEARNCGQSEAPEDNFPSQIVKPCSVSFCANSSASLWPLQLIPNEYLRKHDCSSLLAAKNFITDPFMS